MSKLVDERGRIFGKVSLIDILVVFFALMMALAVYLRFFTDGPTSARKGDDTFSYTLKVETVRQWTLDGLHEGDTLWEAGDDICLGKITHIEAVPATAEYSLVDGSLVIGDREDRYDVYITVETDGLISNGQYYASRTYELGTNTSVYFYTKYCSVAATVWSMG